MEEKMKKNILLLGLLVFVFASCNTDTGSERTVWSDITSLDQVDGTWVGTHSQSMPLKDIVEAAGLLESGMVEPPMQAAMIEVLIKDVNVDIAAKLTMDIDAGAQTRSNVVKSTITFSGGSTAALWVMLKPLLFAEEISSGVSFNDQDHSVTIDQDEPATAVTVEDLYPFQVNQNRTKMRAVIDSSELGPLGAFESMIPSEIILEKQ
jgi:hypothetical protein